MVRTAASIFSPDEGGPLKRRKRTRYPAPTPYFVLTGAITPDVTGSYFEAGVYDGKPYYKLKDQNWFIWYWSGGEPAQYFWYITTEVGAAPGAYWYKFKAYYEPPTGYYQPSGGAIGMPTVAAG